MRFQPVEGLVKVLPPGALSLRVMFLIFTATVPLSVPVAPPAVLAPPRELVLLISELLQKLPLSTTQLAVTQTATQTDGAFKYESEGTA